MQDKGSYQTFFARHAVFTREEFESYFAATKTAEAIEPVLAYYRKTDRIARVRRGLYVSIPPGRNPHDYPADPFLLAGKMTDDAVIGYHTSLAFHERAYSVSGNFSFITARAARSFTQKAYVFRAVSVPKKLVEKSKQNLGVITAERTGLDIRVTSLERTMVDVLDRPDLGGGWEEIWRSLESIEYVDTEKVIEYALELENATTIAKVGFYLEQHREELMISDGDLESLRLHTPKKPHYMERKARKTGKLMKGWNLVVPEEVVRRSWQEVL